MLGFGGLGAKAGQIRAGGPTPAKAGAVQTAAVKVKSVTLSSVNRQKVLENTGEVQVNMRILEPPKPTPPTPDFDGNGEVGFSDFIQFARVFGAKEGEVRYDRKFDLDENGEIGFSDFVRFARDFGKKVG